jgi:hypothetical protein
MSAVVFGTSTILLTANVLVVVSDTYTNIPGVNDSVVLELVKFMIALVVLIEIFEVWTATV